MTNLRLLQLRREHRELRAHFIELSLRDRIVGELFDSFVAVEAGGGGSSAIGAKAIGIANLRLLARPGLIAALFGLLDCFDERLDFTQRIGIDARQARSDRAPASC